MGLLTFLIFLIIIVAFVAAGVWIVDKTVPAPAQMFAKAIIGIVALIGLLYLVAGALGLDLGALKIN